MSGANACDDHLCDASLHKEQMRRNAQCVPCSKCTNGFNASAVVARADAALGVSLGETAPSADLGGSSKYSNENFEDRSGEGFHVNSNWTWVSRS